MSIICVLIFSFANMDMIMVLRHRLYLTFFFFCLVINSIAGSGSDSISYYFGQADYFKALEIIQKQKKISGEEPISHVLYEAEIMLALGKISEAGHILNGIKNRTASDKLLNLKYILLQSKSYDLQQKSDSSFYIIWKNRHQWKINEEKYPVEMSELYCALGKHYSSIREFGSSITYFNKALALLSSGNRAKQAKYYANLANAHLSFHQKDSSIRAFEKARLLLENVANTDPDAVETYFILANYCYQSNIDIALGKTFLSKALMVLQEKYPHYHYYYGYYNLYNGSFSYALYDFDQAYKFAVQFEKIAQENPVILSKYKYNNYITILGTLIYKKKYPQAIDYCHHAIQTATGSHLYYYYILGLASKKLGKPGDAKMYFQKIADRSFSYKEPIDINFCGYSYIELARLAKVEKNMKSALNYLEKGLNYYDNKSKPGAIITNLYYECSALYFFEFNDIHKALEYVQLAIVHGCNNFPDMDYLSNPEFDEILYTYDLIEPFMLKAYLLYMLYRESNMYTGLKTSLECQEIAIKLYERKLLEITEEDEGLNLADRKSIALNNAVWYATSLYLATNDTAYAEKAFQFAEKSKMQLLLIKSRKHYHMQKAGLPVNLIEQEEKLNHLIIEAQNALSLSKSMLNDPSSNASANEEILQLYNQREILIQQLKENYPAYYQAKYNYDVAGIKEIQGILKDDQVILEYQLLTTDLITFVISRNDFHIHVQPVNEKVMAEIQKMREMITVNPLTKNSAHALSEFTSSSEFLYNLLISPVYDKIRNKRLIIIPHNELTMIPFEILAGKVSGENPQGFRNINYLIREFSIIYAYSGNLLLDKENRNRKQGKAAGIFQSDVNTIMVQNDTVHFPELKGARSEAHTLRKLTRAKVFTGKSATEKQFISKAGRFRVLHIASHTLMDESNPFTSCILLNQEDSLHNGQLYAWEIAQLKLNAQLVMLSGCNSGYGVMKKNEGLISLARSFFYTGVRTIAFTLWPAADQAGSDISTGFYTGIRGNQSLDIAMQSAKLDFINSADPVKAHPYFWANYIIVGHDDAIQLERKNAWIKFAIAIFAIALMVIAYRKFTGGSSRVIPVLFRHNSR